VGYKGIGSPTVSYFNEFIMPRSAF